MSERLSGKGASANLLAGNRLHLQQGPINLIAKAYGTNRATRAAYEDACRAFNGLLEQLVDQLPLLRQPVVWSMPQARSATGQRMAAAVSPLRRYWITPMAAVAGAVADTIAAALAESGNLQKLFVNNGGDIALWMADGESLSIGVVSSLRRAMPVSKITLHECDQIGGVATSGWDGHSFSLGIADAVTVLATSAAAADAAATLIGNACNIEHWAIKRKAANEIDPNTDLGHRLVTVQVPRLPADSIAQALNNGVALANTLHSKGLICAALLVAQNQWRSVGPFPRWQSAGARYQ